MTLAAALIFCTVLVLFFTNRLFRRFALISLAVAGIGGGALWAWSTYVSQPREEALRKEKEAAAERQLADQEATLANKRDHDVPEDKRWLFLTASTDHDRYFLDEQTVEPDTASSKALFVWIRRTPCPSTFSPYVSRCSSYKQETTSRMWLSCRAQLMNADVTNVLSERAAPQPNTVDEFILRWIQSSKFCFTEADARQQVADERMIAAWIPAHPGATFLGLDRHPDLRTAETFAVENALRHEYGLPLIAPGSDGRLVSGSSLPGMVMPNYGYGWGYARSPEGQKIERQWLHSHAEELTGLPYTATLPSDE